jgi:hypothetical protein
VTGAISLTPRTMVDGTLTPAKEALTYPGLSDLAANRTAWALVGLVLLQVVLVTMVRDLIVLVGAFPARFDTPPCRCRTSQTAYLADYHFHSNWSVGHCAPRTFRLVCSQVVSRPLRSSSVRSS